MVTHTHKKTLKFVKFIEMEVVRIFLVATHKFYGSISTAEASDTEHREVGGEGG